jgi:hypothetical protein
MRGHRAGLLPPEIEEYRDAHWRRENTACIETVVQAEEFIESVGFAACLTDARQPGPSLYVAVCGRRDATMPRNVQKDAETSHTWALKDQLMRRGRVYYGKLARGKAMFLAPRMIRYFKALWGVPRREEGHRLSESALRVLRVLRKEWEMGTADLRLESGVSDRKRFTQALDELQKAMIVVPNEAAYQPKFSYLWGLAEERFPKELATKVDRHTALREIARCFLSAAGMTVPGELARVTALSRPEAGLGNRALVTEGYAVRVAQGIYRLTALGAIGSSMHSRACDGRDKSGAITRKSCTPGWKSESTSRVDKEKRKTPDATSSGKRRSELPEQGLSA